MSTVHLVGAGPGDPDLLTVRAYALITHAKVLAYDELVPHAILALAPTEAERIPVGRRCAGVRHHDARIHPLVLERARQGHDVVRLKGGDPMTFGRGGEEVDALREAGIAVTVVPGITAALGAAATLGFPLTHRDLAHSVTLRTGHPSAAARPAQPTEVFYMVLRDLEGVCEELVREGRNPETPALIVSNATLPDQRQVGGTLATIAERAREADLASPAILFVGEVVTLAAADRLERLDELREARFHGPPLRLPLVAELPRDLDVTLFR